MYDFNKSRGFEFENEYDYNKDYEHDFGNDNTPKNHWLIAMIIGIVLTMVAYVAYNHHLFFNQ